MEKTIYYTDELNDDFSSVKVKSKPLKDNYQYISKNPFRKIFDNIFYYVIAYPIVFLYQKIVFREKIVNKKVLKPYRKTGYFLYGNHTRMAGDAFAPSLIAFPKKAFIVTNADSASNPFVRFITKTLGNMPLPSSLAGMKNFRKAMKEQTDKGSVITIYPEAHIWPYYTKIRPYKDTSFRYPAEYNKPVFTFTVTYRKGKFKRKPATTVYIDGPFFNDSELNIRENQKGLHDKALNSMVKASEKSDFSYINYKKAV